MTKQYDHPQDHRHECVKVPSQFCFLMAWVIINVLVPWFTLSVVLEGEGRQYFVVVAFSLHAKI